MQLQGILGNISWLSLDRFVRMGVGLVVGVWVARYLGPQQFGLLNFAAAFVGLFGPLAALGLDAIVVRDIVHGPGNQDETLGTAFSVKLIAGACSGTIATALIFFVRPQEALTHWLVGIAAAGFLFQSLDALDFWFQAEVRSKYTVYARNFAFLLVAGLKVGLIMSHAALIWFAWAGLLELSLAAAGLAYFYRKKGRRMRAWRLKVDRAKSLLSESWPLFLSGVSIALYMRIDQVMLGYMLNDTVVGTYSVAIRLVEIWYFIPLSIATSVFPSLVRAREESPDRYHRRLQILYDAMSAIAIVVACLTSVFSHTIIALLYGPEYAAAAPVLAIYTWASVPVFLGVASSQYFLVENLTRITLYRTVAGGVANVVLNLVLIPALGPIGAAIATLMSYSVATFFVVLFRASGNQVSMMLNSMNPLRLIRYATKL